MVIECDLTILIFMMNKSNIMLKYQHLFLSTYSYSIIYCQAATKCLNVPKLFFFLTIGLHSIFLMEHWHIYKRNSRYPCVHFALCLSIFSNAINSKLCSKDPLLTLAKTILWNTYVLLQSLCPWNTQSTNLSFLSCLLLEECH